MRTLKNPEERKNDILDAAEMLFSSKGYAKTTINDILHALNIAKGTFYYYFKSKEELMDAVVMRFVDMGVSAAEIIASDPNLTATEKMFHIISTPASETERKDQLIEQFHEVGNAEMHQKSLVETVLKLTPVLTDIVKQGIKEGSFKTPYPREVVEFLLVSSQFLLDVGLFPWSPEELIEKAKVFSFVMETMLGAEEGTFSYIYTRYEQMLNHQNTASTNS